LFYLFNLATEATEATEVTERRWEDGKVEMMKDRIEYRTRNDKV
jgi:hypothetical protein